MLVAEVCFCPELWVFLPRIPLHSCVLQGGRELFERITSAVSDWNSMLQTLYGNAHWPTPEVRGGGGYKMWKAGMQQNTNKRKYAAPST
jgi:hypothetical protein